MIFIIWQEFTSFQIDNPEKFLLFLKSIYQAALVGGQARVSHESGGQESVSLVGSRDQTQLVRPA